jgi:CheY-like chemotaxis protein
MEKNPEILIVDDDRIVRMILSETLSQGGFTNILTATNGVEAIAMIKQHKPDLVITDMMMPGMDGFQMIQEIKNDASLKDISVIVLTSREEMKELITMTEVPYFITKPFEKEKVLETVREVLNSERSVSPGSGGAIEKKAMLIDERKYKAAGGLRGVSLKTDACLSAGRPASPGAGRQARAKKAPPDRTPLHEKIRKILGEGG